MKAVASRLVVLLALLASVGCSSSGDAGDAGDVTSEGRFGPLRTELTVGPTSPALDDSLTGWLTMVNTGDDPIEVRRPCPSSISLLPNTWDDPEPPTPEPGQQPTALDALTLAFAAARTVPFEGDACDPGEVLTMEGGDVLTTEGSLDVATLGLGPGSAEVRAQIGLGAVYVFDDIAPIEPIVVELPTPSTERLPLDRALTSALELPALQEWAAGHDQGFEADVNAVEDGWVITVGATRGPSTERLDQVVVRVDDEGARLAP